MPIVKKSRIEAKNYQFFEKNIRRVLKTLVGQKGLGNNKFSKNIRRLLQNISGSSGRQKGTKNTIKHFK